MHSITGALTVSEFATRIKQKMHANRNMQNASCHMSIIRLDNV